MDGWNNPIIRLTGRNKDPIRAGNCRLNGRVPCSNSDGQASIEILSYMALVLLATAAISMHVWGDWADTTKVSSANLAVSDIAKTAVSVWSHGPGRRQTITVRIPPDVIHGWAADNRLVYRILLSTGTATDVIEAVDAPIRGTLPTQEGIHQLQIEYRDSGIVTVGGCLFIDPAQTDVTVGSPGEFSKTFSIINLCEKDMSGIDVDIIGQASEWATVNETTLSLMAGNKTFLQASFIIPSDTPASVFTSYITAESGPAYSEASIYITVNSSMCGDGVLDMDESCEAKIPGYLPDTDCLFCPNNATLSCDESNARYMWADPYGTCTSECECEFDSPSWTICGPGCTDPLYCGVCEHCTDGVRNCAETSTDSGPACPSCDGVDDILQGYECSLGDTMACGASGCQGTKRCERAGSACQWSACTSYLKDCVSSCCICGGDPMDPSSVFDGSTARSLSDCPGIESHCADQTTCSGKKTSRMCSTIGSCEADEFGILNPIEEDLIACQSMECAPEILACDDQSYPCHGTRTLSRCDGLGECRTSTTQDDTVCAGIAACQAPQEIILHKMDFGSMEYVDSPSSLRGWMGGFLRGNCETESAYYPLVGMHITDVGAYSPYHNGTLNFYSRASRYVDDVSHAVFDCTWVCGCDVRIGSDDLNWKQWNAQCPASRHWTKTSIDMASPPADSMGTIDWDRINYLRFRFGAYHHVCFQCQRCFGNVDYVTLER